MKGQQSNGDTAFDPGALKRLEESGRTLGLAYRVRTRIYTDVKKDILKVPRTALFRGGRQSMAGFFRKERQDRSDPGNPGGCERRRSRNQGRPQGGRDHYRSPTQGPAKWRPGQTLVTSVL